MESHLCWASDLCKGRDRDLVAAGLQTTTYPMEGSLSLTGH